MWTPRGAGRGEGALWHMQERACSRTTRRPRGGCGDGGGHGGGGRRAHQGGQELCEARADRHAHAARPGLRPHQVCGVAHHRCVLAGVLAYVQAR
eukprot:1158473-Pelagomonas_calceolata.AAC.3